MKRVMTPLEREVSIAPSPIRRGDDGRDLQLAAFIVQLVATSTGVSAEEIASTSRRCAETARARQISMYLSHIGFAWPLGRVAGAFGRDRSTISYACRRVEDLRDDAQFDAVLQRLETCVRAAPFSGARA